MACVEITTKKYWEKPVFSQLMKCEMTTIKGTQKGQKKQTFKCFVLPKNTFWKLKYGTIKGPDCVQYFLSLGHLHSPAITRWVLVLMG